MNSHVRYQRCGGCGRLHHSPHAFVCCEGHTSLVYRPRTAEEVAAQETATKAVEDYDLATKSLDAAIERYQRLFGRTWWDPPTCERQLAVVQAALAKYETVCAALAPAQAEYSRVKAEQDAKMPPAGFSPPQSALCLWDMLCIRCGHPVPAPGVALKTSDDRDQRGGLAQRCQGECEAPARAAYTESGGLKAVER